MALTKIRGSYHSSAMVKGAADSGSAIVKRVSDAAQGGSPSPPINPSYTPNYPSSDARAALNDFAIK